MMGEGVMEERPYQCPYCAGMFPDRGTLLTDSALSAKMTVISLLITKMMVNLNHPVLEAWALTKRIVSLAPEREAICGCTTLTY